jgi:hypothetical protein
MLFIRLTLIGATLLSTVLIAFSWEVEKGSQGNELLLEVRNSSDRALEGVSVNIDESPRWVHFDASEIPAAGVLEPGEKRIVSFLFNVAEQVSPETEGRVNLRVKALEGTWRKDISLTVLPPTALPQFTTLYQSSPNPFCQSAVICYQLSERARTLLRVYNLAGRLVRTLVDEEKPAGFHQIEWTGQDEENKTLPNGTYFYSMNAGSFTSTLKLVLLR